MAVDTLNPSSMLPLDYADAEFVTGPTDEANSKITISAGVTYLFALQMATTPNDVTFRGTSAPGTDGNSYTINSYIDDQNITLGSNLFGVEDQNQLIQIYNLRGDVYIHDGAATTPQIQEYLRLGNYTSGKIVDRHQHGVLAFDIRNYVDQAEEVNFARLTFTVYDASTRNDSGEKVAKLHVSRRSETLYYDVGWGSSGITGWGDQGGDFQDRGNIGVIMGAWDDTGEANIWQGWPGDVNFIVPPSTASLGDPWIIGNGASDSLCPQVTGTVSAISEYDEENEQTTITVTANKFHDYMAGNRNPAGGIRFAKDFSFDAGSSYTIEEIVSRTQCKVAGDASGESDSDTFTIAAQTAAEQESELVAVLQAMIDNPSDGFATQAEWFMKLEYAVSDSTMNTIAFCTTGHATSGYHPKLELALLESTVSRRLPLGTTRGLRKRIAHP